ncbi:MAG: hypothetical protein WCP35_11460 [Verrucomicrobiota bacterium]
MNYLTYASIQRVKAVLRAGRTLLLPKNQTLLCVLLNDLKTDSTELECVSLPSGTVARRPLPVVLKQIAEYQGEFYSVKDAAGLKAHSPAAP